MYRRTAILGNSRMCKTLIGVQALWHLARLEATMVYKGALMNESVRFESDPVVTGQRGFSEVAVTRPETFVQQWSFAARIKRSVCWIVREPRRTRHRTAVSWKQTTVLGGSSSVATRHTQTERRTSNETGCGGT